MSEKEKDKPSEAISRRDFVRKGSYVAGGAIGGAVLGGFITQRVLNLSGPNGAQPPAAEEVYNRALMFFTNQEDFTIISQAAERIFPEDELGPGAINLDVPYYIDHQLAGEWGYNARDYMLGPFYPGLKTQGFQSHLRRNEIFTQGIYKLKEYSQTTFKKRFTELSAEEQEQVLTAFQKNEVPMQGVSSAEFFQLLRTVVLEGVYADPLYGGNRNMAAWEMKGFPGNQMSYYSQIESEEFIQIKPSSLHSHMQSPDKHA